MRILSLNNTEEVNQFLEEMERHIIISNNLSDRLLSKFEETLSYLRIDLVVVNIDNKYINELLAILPIDNIPIIVITEKEDSRLLKKLLESNIAGFFHSPLIRREHFIRRINNLEKYKNIFKSFDFPFEEKILKPGKLQLAEILDRLSSSLKK